MTGPLHVRCPADASSIRAVRRRLADHLHDRGLPVELTERAALVVSELLTNAVEASPDGAEVTFTASARNGMVTMTIENRCATGPDVVTAFSSVAMPAGPATRGRGLPLVAAVATRLSITVESGSVRVSADLMERSPA